MHWPFHIVFLGQGRPIWGYRLHNLTSKKKHADTASQHHTFSSCWSLWKMWQRFSIKGDTNLKFLAFHLAGSVRETRDWIIFPGVMNMVTNFKHTHTAHFPKWSHFALWTTHNSTWPFSTRTHSHKLKGRKAVENSLDPWVKRMNCIKYLLYCTCPWLFRELI